MRRPADRHPAAAQVLADLPDPVCRWRPDTTLTYVNPAYADLTGRAAEALVGRRLVDLFGVPSAAAAIAAVAAVLRTLTPAAPDFAYEHEHGARRAGGGATRWLHWTNRAVFDARGRLVAVQSLGRDVTAYRRAVAQARDGEARYRALAEHSHDAIARVALDGRCRYVSPAYERLSGFPAAAVVGRPPLEHCHPDDWPALLAISPEQLDRRDGAVLTYRTRHRTRGWVRVESTLRPVRDAAGRVVEYVLVARDLEARTATEDALRDSEQRLDLALAAAEMGLWDWDLASGRVTCDARWAAQLGYTLAELPAQPGPWPVGVHPDDRRGVQARLDAHLRGETELYASEHRLRAKDGTWRWMYARGRVVERDGEGRPRRVVGLQRDIGERVRADEALRASEMQLRALIENVPDFVAVADLDGTVTYLNRAAPRQPLERVLGRRVDELVAPADRARVRACLAQVVRTGVMQTVELQGPAAGGGARRYVARLVPLLRAGAVQAVTIITSEVTAQHAREETLRRFNAELETRVNARTAELQASLRELESFSYSVSHDLRAPLRAIDGFSQALAEDYAARLDATGLDYLARVRHGAQRMGELIDDLLGLARVLRKDLRCEPVALGALAHEVAQELAGAEPSRAVTVVIDASLTATGDRVLLRAALANLLGNAWKFTRDRPDARIELGADRRGGERVFYVRDNGVGFDMAYVAKLFRPFQRLHEPGEFEGSGIGLATVQRIIARHGGWIWAESIAGSGATFFFTLPEPCARGAAS